TLLQILFSVFTFGMFAPVLQVLFSQDKKPVQQSGSGLTEQISARVYEMMQSQSPVRVLAVIIAIVVGFTILKNLFLYLSLYIMNPLKNAVLRRLRDDLFTKTLSLPIGFFTEE